MENKYEHIDLTNEKVIRIVNSAFQVFTNNEFDKASTNKVVQQAGVSRGLLYHYFEGKQDLFEFLLHFSVSIIGEKIRLDVSLDDSDLLDRMVKAFFIKLDLMEDYPYMLAFFNKYKEQFVKLGARQYIEVVYPGLVKDFYTKNIDLTLLKNPDHKEKLINLVRYTLKGITDDNEDLYGVEDFTKYKEKVIEKSNEYMAFIREQFYN